MGKKDLLSIVVPCHNEEESLNIFYDTLEVLKNTMNSVAFEYVFIDDGSKDNTWLKIAELGERNENVLGIKLSKNFGKEGAILAGLTKASGDAIVIIDSDLQHPPELIREMYRIWRSESVDIVEGVKERRGKESLLYKAFAYIFYSIIGKIGNTDIRDSSDFQLLDRKLVDVLINLPERQRFFRGLSSWMGYRRVQIPFAVAQREQGKSKWNFFKLFKYAITNITSFSAAPLQIVTITGILFFIAASALSIQTFYVFITHRAIEGFTTVILLLLIIGAMLMLSLGVLGVYVGKIYEEVKGRPSFLIESTINSKKEV
jgi:dolichol-phosphate mannosyltransferase